MIQYCQNISKRDFISKTESATRKRKGKREYLNDLEIKELLRKLNEFFETKLEIPRIKICEKQIIETLSNEEDYYLLNISEMKIKYGIQNYLILKWIHFEK